MLTPSPTATGQANASETTTASSAQRSQIALSVPTRRPQEPPLTRLTPCAVESSKRCRTQASGDAQRMKLCPVLRVRKVSSSTVYFSDSLR